MISRLGNRRVETHEEMRARILRETSVYITECLRRPELAVRIPVVQAGRGQFPPSMTGAFWEPILQE